MSGLESWVLSYLLNSVWQVPLLFAVGLLAARTLRAVGDAAEHRVWVCVLLLQSVLPAISALPLEWFRTFFAFGIAHKTGEGNVSVMMGAGIGLGALHLPQYLLPAIAFAYGTATTYFAARFLWRWMRISTMRREAVELTLSGEAAIDWAQCQRRFGIGEVSIASSSRIRSPVTMGLSRKLLLLPAGMAASVAQADLRAVIAHEFAHMRRNDFLKNLCYELVSLPAAYHPMFWLTRERIMESREVICDQMAAEIAGRTEYARSLLRLASRLVKGTPIRTPHAIGIFDANAFERRIMKLTDKRAEIRGARRFAIVAACAVVGVGACVSALALRLPTDAVNTTTVSDNHTPQKAGTITVPSSAMAGNVLTKYPPKYPEAAKKAKIQGAVLLDAVVGKDGTIEKLTVVSGPKELQQASLDAVQKWTYKPYLLNGEPVDIETTISVIYSLAK